MAGPEDNPRDEDWSAAQAEISKLESRIEDLQSELESSQQESSRLQDLVDDLELTIATTIDSLEQARSDINKH